MINRTKGTLHPSDKNEHAIVNVAWIGFSCIHDSYAILNEARYRPTFTEITIGNQYIEERENPRPEL